MKDLIHIVTAEIRAGISADFQQTLLRAALLIEKFCGSGDWQGIEEELDDAEASERSFVELRDTLMTFARCQREHPDVGTALWALGKAWQSSLREFFLNEMRVHLAAKRFFPLSQAECALFHFGGSDSECGNTLNERAPEPYFAACREFLERELA